MKCDVRFAVSLGAYSACVSAKADTDASYEIQYNQLCDNLLFSSSLFACLSVSFQYSGSSPDQKFDERAGMCYEHWQGFSSLLPCSLLAYLHMSNVKSCL